MSNLSLRDAAICWRSKELDGKEEERGAFVFALESQNGGHLDRSDLKHRKMYPIDVTHKIHESISEVPYLAIFMLLLLMKKGKDVVIEEVVEDDEVKEASETGNSGKQLLLVTENDVQTKTEPLTPPWNKRLSEEFQFRKMLFDIDLTFGLDFSHKTLEMKNKVKAEQEMEELVHNDFHPLMYEDDLLQNEDPINYQQDPYHGEDEAKENVELFDEQDHLLEHVPFLK
nr:hypothetical protein [Tanacetum cinerariifolium]